MVRRWRELVGEEPNDIGSDLVGDLAEDESLNDLVLGIEPGEGSAEDLVFTKAGADGDGADGAVGVWEVGSVWGVGGGFEVWLCGVV